MRPKIVLDTNVLLMPAKRKFDLIAECERLLPECELAVLKPTLEELKMLGAKRTKDGAAARIALILVQRNGFHEIDVPGARKADEAMVALAGQGKKMVFATNDAVLRRRLRALHARTICLKGESHLDWC